MLMYDRMELIRMQCDTVPLMIICVRLWLHDGKEIFLMSNNKSEKKHIFPC